MLGTGRWGANKLLDGAVGGTAFVNSATRKDLEKLEKGHTTTARRHNNTVEGARADLGKTVERNEAFIQDLLGLKQYVNENGALDLTRGNGPGEKRFLDICEKIPGMVLDNLILNTVGLLPDAGMDLVGNFGRQYGNMTKNDPNRFREATLTYRADMTTTGGSVNPDSAFLYSAGSAFSQTAIMGVVKRIPGSEPLQEVINLSYDTGGELLAEAMRQGLEFPDTIYYVQDKFETRFAENSRKKLHLN